MSNTYKEHKDSQKTDAWLAANGINSKALYVGTAEVYQALKLATNTLKTNGGALGPNEAHTLNNFIRIANSTKRRAKITQAQCFRRCPELSCRFELVDGDHYAAKRWSCCGRSARMSAGSWA